MDRKLYVERWLLAVKDACTAIALPAHVRALDHKGGQRLSLVLRHGDEAAEFCYRKRLTGVRMLVAVTTPGFATRIQDIFTRLRNEHRRLLENGYRRFLKRSIRLLGEIESAFANDAALQSKLAAVRTIPDAKDARPAILARRLRGLPARYEILPAAGFFTPTSARFMGVVERKLVELIDLIPGEQKVPTPPSASNSVTNDSAPSSSGPVELVSLAVPAAVAAGAVAAGAPGLIEEVKAAAAGAVPPPAIVPPPGGGGDGALAIIEGIANTVDLGAVAVEGVANAGSCLGDAACSAPDCSGVDMSGLDCGGVDCGGF